MFTDPNYILNNELLMGLSLFGFLLKKKKQQTKEEKTKQEQVEKTHSTA